MNLKKWISFFNCCNKHWKYFPLLQSMFAWWKASFNNLYFKPYMMKIIMKLNSDKVNILCVYFCVCWVFNLYSSQYKTSRSAAAAQQMTKIHTTNKLTALYKTTVLFFVRSYIIHQHSWMNLTSYICAFCVVTIDDGIMMSWFKLYEQYDERKN